MSHNEYKYIFRNITQTSIHGATCIDTNCSTQQAAVDNCSFERFESIAKEKLALVNTTCDILDSCSFQRDSCINDTVENINDKQKILKNLINVSCTFIDLCKTEKNNCPSNSKGKMNLITKNSFECFCNSGFIFIGTNCMNINECLTGNVCSNGDCIDTKGSYKCDCNDGYISDGNTNCINLDECKLNPCNGTDTCIDTIGSYICQP